MKGAILIAVGNAVLGQQLVETLREAGIQVLTAVDGHDAWRQLTAEGGPRVAFFDTELKGIDGPELARRLRERTQTPYIYTALMEQHRVSPANWGWFDTVLRRPLNLGDVVVRAYGALELMYPRRHEGATHPSATPIIDRETGLWDTKTFDGFLGDCIDASGEPPFLTVVALRFEGIPADGGRVGQMALRACARTVRESTRGTDAIARSGAHTFICVLQAATEVTTRHVVARIRTRLAGAQANLPGLHAPVRMVHCVMDLSREAERDPGKLRALLLRRLAFQSAPPVHLVAC